MQIDLVENNMFERTLNTHRRRRVVLIKHSAGVAEAGHRVVKPAGAVMSGTEERSWASNSETVKLSIRGKSKAPEE